MVIFKAKTEGNEAIWDGKKAVPFVEGKLETGDKMLIAILDRSGYERIGGAEDGETEQRDTGRQEVEAEQAEPTTETEWNDKTKNEIVKELVRRGVEFNKRQPKSELIDLLGGD